MKEFLIQHINLNQTEYIILPLLFIIVSIKVIFHAKYYFRFKNRPKYQNLKSNPVSVILAVGKQARLLESNLPYFLNQKHTEYEVIVVYDIENKDMLYVLDGFAATNAHLRILPFDYVVNSHNNNQFVMSIGIRVAKYDHVILGDISTRPETEHWAEAMSKCFTEKFIQNEIGCCKVSPQKGLANIWMRYNHLQNAVCHCYYALSGKAFSGDMRNLAFERQSFLNSSAFAKYYNVDFGNESIDINKSARFLYKKIGYNTAVMLDEGSFVITNNDTSFGTWFRSQIKQHVFLRKINNKVKHNIHIKRWFVFVYYLLVAMTVVLFFKNFGIVQNVGLFGLSLCFLLIILKITLESISLIKIMKIFHEKLSLFSIILCELFGIIAYPAARIRSWFSF